MSNKSQKCKCKGENSECPVCEGTGIVLYDENTDNALILLDIKTYNSELEEEDGY